MVTMLFPFQSVFAADNDPEFYIGEATVDISNGGNTVTVPVMVKNNPGFASIQLQFGIPENWSINEVLYTSSLTEYSIYYELKDMYGTKIPMAKDNANFMFNAENGKLAIGYPNNISATEGAVCWIKYMVPAGTVNSKDGYEITISSECIDPVGDIADIKDQFTFTSGAIKVTGGIPVENVTPSITTQPTGATYTYAPTAPTVTPLTVAASVTQTEGSTLTYQWYSKATEENAEDTKIEGATEVSYTPSLSAFGTAGYYCVVTNTYNGQKYTATSDVAAVTYNKAAQSADNFTVTFPDSLVYNGSAKTVTVTAKEGVDAGAITVKYNGETTAPSNAGTYAITYDVAATANTEGLTNVSAGDMTITKVKVPVPTAKSSLTYTGSAQSGVTYNVDDSAPYTASGDLSATNKGNYEATFELKNTTNYEWADANFTGKVPWSIAPASIAVSGSKAMTVTNNDQTDSITESIIKGTPVCETTLTYAYEVTEGTNLIEVTDAGVVSTISNTEGTATIKVTISDEAENHTDAVDYITVTVKNKAVTGIEITKNPTKMTGYVEGQPLDTAGMEVKVSYDDESYETINSGFTVTPATLETTTTTVTITYAGKTATLTLGSGAVVPKVIESIAVTHQPTKTTYVIGDTADWTGLEVTATYNDGDTRVLGADEYTVTGFNSSAYAASQTITVTDTTKDKTATFTVTIDKKTLTADNFTVNIPAGLTYDRTEKTATVTAKEGVAAGTVTVKYNGSTTAPVNAGSYTVTFDVTESDIYKAAAGLAAGTLVIGKATPTITIPNATMTVVKDATATAIGATIVGVTGETETLTLTYTSADTSKVTVSADGKVTGVGFGTANVTVSYAESNNYNAASETVSVEVTDKSPVTVTFGNAADKTYTPAGYKLGEQFSSATVPSEYSASDISYTYNGTKYETLEALKAVIVINAGTYTVKAVYETETHKGTAEAKFVIKQADQAELSVNESDATFDTPLALTTTGGSGTGAVTYTVTVGTGSATVSGSTLTPTMVGTVTVTATKAADNNYKAVTSAPKTITIAQAAAPASIAGVNANYKFSVTGAKTAAITGVPADAGTVTYTVGTVTDASSVLDGTPTVSNVGVVSFTLKGLDSFAEDITATIPVTVAMTNYVSKTVNVVISITDKDTPTVSVQDISKTYTGVALTAADIKGTATFDGTAVTGSWAFTDYDADTMVNVGTYDVTVKFTPEDSVNYAEATTTITIAITKATPTGEPAYTAINAANKTLADAELEIGTLTPAGGTLIWVDGDGNELAADTKVKANRAYTWKYTPDDTTNYNTISGEIVLYVYRAVVSPAIGNAINVARVENGAVKLSTDNARPGRVVTITVSPADGYELESLLIYDTKDNLIQVTDHGDGTYSFVMPNCDVTVKVSFAKVTSDSAISFVDVPADSWYADAVAMMVNKGLFNGTSATTFSPNGNMTRAMLWTVLARMEGVDTTGGANWYEKGMNWAITEGISDGTNPGGNITREQLITMLWRYVGSPSASENSLRVFADVDDISSWATTAMAWATENGILNGINGNALPASNATRAQVAVILMRFVEKFAI